MKKELCSKFDAIANVSCYDIFNFDEKISDIFAILVSFWSAIIYYKNNSINLLL